MPNQTEQIDFYVARAVALIYAFVSMLLIMGPLFFFYYMMSGFDPIYEWGTLALSMFCGVTLLMIGALRVKGGLPWLVCIAIPLSQLAGLVYLVS